MKTLVSSIFIVLCLAAWAEKQPFERYQSIIDRQMFGELPPGFDPTKLPSEVVKTSAKSQQELTKEQEKLQSAIHFSVINVSPEGETSVGFTDNSDPKAPKHYYLKVGEERDGWKVKEADPVAASMTIAKDEIEVSLTIGDNSAKGGGTTSRAGAAANSDGGMVRRSPGLLNGGGSLRSRRMFRQQQAQQRQQQAQAEADAKAAEREAERQAQAEQERVEREAERAEQKKQLLAIQEELKKAREQRQQASESNENNDAQ